VIANAMLVSAVAGLAVVFGLMQRCTYLIPYRALLWGEYRWTIAVWGGLAFLNLFAACYAASRTLFLKHTGEKLAHLEKQVRSGDPLAAELARRLADDDDDEKEEER
jgi:hypothetical protein